MQKIVQIGQWQLNWDNNTLIHGHLTKRLEQKQFDLLLFLAENAGENVTKSAIFSRVWANKVVTEDVIYVAINALRKALGDNARSPLYIKTISGVGYRLIAQVVEKSSPCAVENVVNDPDKQSWLTVFTERLLKTTTHLFERSTQPVELQDELLADFQEARYLLSKCESFHPKAIELLQKITRLSPHYAPAYVELASAKMVRLFEGNALLYAEKERVEGILLHALTLDPNNKLAKQALANLYFIVFQDFEKALRYFKQSLPEGDSHYFYAQFLLALGKFEETQQQLNLHIQKYPNEYSKECTAWVFTMQRQYEKALSEILKLKPYAAENFYYHVSLQAIYELMGNEDDAFAELSWLMNHAGYTEQEMTIITQIFNRKKLTGVYHWLAFTDKKQLDIGQYCPPLSLARYSIGAGDLGLALSWLEQAEKQQQPSLLWVAVDPKYLPLYNKQRFQRLLKKLNLSAI